MKFGYPDHLIYLTILLPLAILFAFALHRRFKDIRQLGDLGLVGKLIPTFSKGKVMWKSVLLFLAFSSVLFAYAAPQIGSRLKEVKRKGIEIVIALDISNSMLADDIKPSRLQKAKYTISKLVDNLGNDRVGLVAFAGQSFLQCPMTSDKSALKMYLDVISTKDIATQGTNFSSAINQSLKAIKSIEKGANAEEKNQTRNKVIVIFSDGEDHEAGIETILQKALEQQVRIYTVGVGSDKPTPIPIRDEYGRQIDFKRDKQSSIVTTKFQEPLLRKIAGETNGFFYRITPQSKIYDQIVNDINDLEKKELATKEIMDYDHQFQFFLGLALCFLVLETLLTDRKRLKND